MLQDYPPLVQTLMGTGFTWALTALGASFCVLQSPYSQRWVQHLLLDISLGFSIGVMLSASFWSLLEPALEITKGDFEMGSLSFIPPVVGLILGVLFLCISDVLLPVKWLEPVKGKEKVDDAISYDDQPTVSDRHPSSGFSEIQLRSQPSTRTPLQHEIDDSSATKAPTNLVMTRRLWLLIIAVTVHNIPEGLAVGVAFGGIGQNSKATFYNARYGQLSGLVEPIAGVFGCIAIQTFSTLQPYALGFAAGAMIFVVIDDLIPEAHSRNNGRLASIMAIVGFIIMMVLEVLPVNS